MLKSQLSSNKLISPKSTDFERGTKLVPLSFFNQSTLVVAQELLGKTLVIKNKFTTLKSKIVETEAYLENDDPASHCAKGPTRRSKIMYAKPGTVYIYFIYGCHHMLNFVTEPEGKGGAVLIRAVEPLAGFLSSKKITTNGPGKLTLALGITDKLNAKLLGDESGIFLYSNNIIKPHKIVQTTRIGISKGIDLPFRFYIRGNQFVSKL